MSAVIPGARTAAILAGVRAMEPSAAVIKSKPLYVDRYYLPILSAVCKVQRTHPTWTFTQIYKQVCLNLGASEEEASEGIAICPYKQVKKDIRGIIRSWIEERSPHSMQHYFRDGKLASWGSQDRPLLFVNEELGRKNAESQWHPYSYNRGNGWSLNISSARQFVKPSSAVLETAVAMYRRIGRRGKIQAAHKKEVPITISTIVSVGH